MRRRRVLTLALDTSTRRGSVALGARDPDGIALLGEEVLEVSATHSETVLPAIDRLLIRHGRSIGDVSEVVVGSGPGSFTGVRIAASLARGICFAGGATLFAYSSLASIAAETPLDGEGGRVCALLDARRGQVYAAGFSVDREDGSIETLFPARACSLAELLSELQAPSWLFAGVIPPALREAVSAADGRLTRGVIHPSGPGLLYLAAREPGGRVEHPARWEPVYVRSSSAERRMGEA